MARIFTFDTQNRRLVDYATGAPIARVFLGTGDKDGVEVNFGTPGTSGQAPIIYTNESTGTVRFGIVLPGTQPTSGSYTLTMATTGVGAGATTGAIPVGASAATVQAALEALTSIGSGNVTVALLAADFFRLTFGGALALTDVPLITGATVSLSPTSGVTTGVEQEGTGSVNEIQVYRLERTALAEVSSWSNAGSPSYGFTGQLDCNTALLKLLLGTSASASATLEVELLRSTGDRVTIQTPVTINNEGFNQTSSTPSPIESALTTTSADARYARITPTDGNYKVVTEGTETWWKLRNQQDPTKYHKLWVSNGQVVLGPAE